MSNRKKPTSKQSITRDQKIVETNPYLELQKEHKNWYEKNQMGRQGEKPQMVTREIKKAKGSGKHSLRKEK